MTAETVFKHWMLTLITLFILLFSYIVVADLNAPMTSEGRVQSHVVQIAPEVSGNIAHDFVRQIKGLSRRLSLPTGFAELKHTDFAAIARNARKEVTANYPVKNLLSVKSCEEILHRLLLA